MEAGQADAQVAEVLVEDVRLALRGQLARNYFALRTLDEEQQVLRDAVTTREANLKLAQRRVDGGITPELGVARAATELAATRSELASLKGPRTRLENAIAVLLGEAPSDFRLDARGLSAKLPGIRAGLPMETLAARSSMCWCEDLESSARCERMEVGATPKPHLVSRHLDTVIANARKVPGAPNRVDPLSAHARVDKHSGDWRDGPGRS